MFCFLNGSDGLSFSNVAVRQNGDAVHAEGMIGLKFKFFANLSGRNAFALVAHIPFAHESQADVGCHAQVVCAFRSARRNQRANVIVDVFLESFGSGLAHTGVTGSHLVQTDDHSHLGDSVIEVGFQTGGLNTHLAFVELNRSAAVRLGFNRGAGNLLIFQSTVVNGQTINVAAVGSSIDRSFVRSLNSCPAFGCDGNFFAGSGNGPKFVHGQCTAVKIMRGGKRQGRDGKKDGDDEWFFHKSSPW